MRTTTGTPDFWGKNSISPESLLATKPLTKETEDSGYETETKTATKPRPLRGAYRYTVHNEETFPRVFYRVNPEALVHVI